MATTKKSKHITGKLPTPQPAGMEVISVYESIALATTDIDLADVVQFFVLPAGCVPVGYAIGVTDMDTAGPTLTANLGLLNTGGTAISTDAADGGNEWIQDLSLGGAAAITLHTASKAAYDILKAVTPSTIDRIVALVISAAAATAASGTATLEFSYKAAN